MSSHKFNACARTHKHRELTNTANSHTQRTDIHSEVTNTVTSHTQRTDIHSEVTNTNTYGTYVAHMWQSHKHHICGTYVDICHICAHMAHMCTNTTYVHICHIYMAHMWHICGMPHVVICREFTNTITYATSYMWHICGKVTNTTYVDICHICGTYVACHMW